MWVPVTLAAVIRDFLEVSLTFPNDCALIIRRVQGCRPSMIATDKVIMVTFVVRVVIVAVCANMMPV